MQNQKSTKLEKHTKYTVSVRIKPNINNQPTCLIPYQSKFIKQSRPKSIITYCFDKVFQQIHDNAYIYETSLKRTVQFFLNKRINTTILAYGQTGSGKTFTLFGSKTKEQMGIVDCMIDDIFSYANQKKINVSCRFMQIYKEKVTDLMTSENVQLRENANGQLILQNISTYDIKEKQEMVQLLQKAHSKKIFGNSYINSQSSRSHVIFTIEMQNRKFNVVDLCGSEVLTYKFNEQQRQQTNSINLSLFTLNAVVNDLAFSQKKKNQFIPFRNSVLTRILKQSLLDVQRSQIYLFCNVSPEQKHQPFSSSTLRFGQLAIQIDEANNIIQQKINLSQQKRQKKMISNIIDINPEINKSQATYKIKWNIQIIKILDKKIKIYQIKREDAVVNIMVLHAYGYGCCGQDFNLFVSYMNKYIKANFYSVDFPGFGDSEGKKFTSRSQKFTEKQQPIEFMTKIFEIFGFSQKNRVVLLGYDLGGAIGLSCCLQPKLSKIIDQLIAFHPTWTDSIEKVAPISVPTLLLWFPVQTFHLVAAGQKMAKLIKNSKLYRLNVGPYTNQKAAGYYDSYTEEMTKLIIQFLQQNQKLPPTQEDTSDNQRGKIIQQKIEININEEQQKMLRAQQAVKEIYRIIQEGQISQVYSTLSKGGPNKPKFVRLAGELPEINLSTFTEEYLLKYLLIYKKTINSFSNDNYSLLIPGQQVQVQTKICLNALSGDKYLAYDMKGQSGITHRAYVSSDQTQQEIAQKQEIKLEIRDVNGQFSIINAPLSNILYLNYPTIYKKNNLGHLIFEDSVTCNYNSNFIKLKILQICFKIQPIISEMNFKQNNQKLLSQQKQCSKIIYQLIDLKHLVHQGIDNTRYTGIDVGRLAYYGQGNCHHLASVTAALLLPFGHILGWEVIFRAGSFFKTGRQIDEDGNPLKQWNGKPKVNVQDHTWLEIRYKPSQKIYVFDPSFAICSAPLDEIYTFTGRMHISGKKLNFASQYEYPTSIFSK